MSREKRTPRRAVLAGVTAVLLGAVAACGGAQPEESPGAPEDPDWVDAAFAGDMSAASEEQLDAMADGEVDAAEYNAGFERFRACLQAEGYELVMMDPIQKEIIEYGIPDAAVQAGVDVECYVQEFIHVDTAWQLAHEWDSPTTHKVRQCLTDRGIEPGTTVDEVYDQLLEAGIDIMDCLGVDAP